MCLKRDLANWRLNKHLLSVKTLNIRIKLEQLPKSNIKGCFIVCNVVALLYSLSIMGKKKSAFQTTNLINFYDYINHFVSLFLHHVASILQKHVNEISEYENFTDQSWQDWP